MKLRTVTLIFATLTFSAFAFGAVATDGDTGYQVRYASHLFAGESYVDLVNDAQTGTSLCANLYAFDAGEELISCCACLITVNAVADIPVNEGLIATTLTGQPVDSITIEEITTIPTAGAAGALTCNAATPLAPAGANSVSRGIKAWGTALHLNTSSGSYQLAETPFTFANLTNAEPENNQINCQFLQSLGSGPGQCKGCGAGALGASSNVN